MVGHRVLGDAESARDLRVVQALVEELGHAPFRLEIRVRHSEHTFACVSDGIALSLLSSAAPFAGWCNWQHA